MGNRYRNVHSTTRTKNRRRYSFIETAGAVCVALFVIAGCSTAQDEPTVSGSAPSAASAAGTVTTAAAIPTASPTPTNLYKPATAQGPAQNVPVPVLPAAAKEFTKAGLEAFARYWYSTLSYAYETGDTKPMTAITDPSCETCAKATKSVTSWVPKFGWIVGGKVTVKSSTSTFKETPEGDHQAIVWVQQAPLTYVKTDSSTYKQFPQSIARPDIVVARFTNGAWIASTAEHLTKD